MCMLLVLASCKPPPLDRALFQGFLIFCFLLSTCSYLTVK